MCVCVYMCACMCMCTCVCVCVCVSYMEVVRGSVVVQVHVAVPLHPSVPSICSYINPLLGALNRNVDLCNITICAGVFSLISLVPGPLCV